MVKGSYAQREFEATIANSRHHNHHPLSPNFQQHQASLPSTSPLRRQRQQPNRQYHHHHPINAKPRGAFVWYKQPKQQQQQQDSRDYWQDRRSVVGSLQWKLPPLKPFQLDHNSKFKSKSVPGRQHYFQQVQRLWMDLKLNESFISAIQRYQQQHHQQYQCQNNKSTVNNIDVDNAAAAAATTTATNNPRRGTPKLQSYASFRVRPQKLSTKGRPKQPSPTPSLQQLSPPQPPPQPSRIFPSFHINTCRTTQALVDFLNNDNWKRQINRILQPHGIRVDVLWLFTTVSKKKSATNKKKLLSPPNTSKQSYTTNSEYDKFSKRLDYHQHGPYRLLIRFHSFRVCLYDYFDMNRFLQFGKPFRNNTTNDSHKQEHGVPVQRQCKSSILKSDHNQIETTEPTALQHFSNAVGSIHHSVEEIRHKLTTLKRKSGALLDSQECDTLNCATKDIPPLSKQTRHASIELPQTNNRATAAADDFPVRPLSRAVSDCPVRILPKVARLPERRDAYAILLERWSQDNPS